MEDRWYQHKKNAEYGRETYLYKAMRKYGVDNFTIEHLSDGLDEEEVLLIEQLQPEYNMTKGGDGGDTSSSPNYKAAISRRDNSGANNPMYGKKGKDNPNYGKQRTEQQKQRSRDVYKGKRIPVRVHGIDYESVARASKELGRSEKYVRLHDERNEWKY
jgi:group I intron endonuclease